MESTSTSEIDEDGILCSIISLLPLKEAIRTCVVSRRWRNIWNYLPTLEFDRGIPDSVFSDDTLLRFNGFATNQERRGFLSQKTDHFIGVVSSVLQQHRGTLDKFMVRYFLHKPHSIYLDAWIRMVVSLKIKKLYLHLEHKYPRLDVLPELYDFPFHLIASSCLEELFIACCSVKPPCRFDGLNRLTALFLWGTDVTLDDMNRLLSNCSSLHALCVLRSKELETLTIPCSLNQLRRLFVKECHMLRTMEIRAVKLNYLCYVGYPVDISCGKCVYVKEAKICFETIGKNRTFNVHLSRLARCLPYVESLTLNISGASNPCSVEDLPTSACLTFFTQLKSLVWDCPEWSVGVKMSLLHLAALLNVAPVMTDLKLILSTAVETEEPPQSLRELTDKLPKHPHSHLKTVKICGFYYERWQLEIILYLLNKATELEEMILEKGQTPCKEIDEMDIHKLNQQVPANVKLLIL